MWRDWLEWSGHVVFPITSVARLPKLLGDATVEGEPLGEISAYLLGVIGLVTLVVRALPTLSGPLDEWLAERRKKKYDATHAEVDELRNTVLKLQADMGQMRDLASAHSEWDRKVYNTLVGHGLADDIGVPPTLF